MLAPTPGYKGTFFVCVCLRVCACVHVSWQWTDLDCFVASLMKANANAPHIYCFSPMTNTQPLPSTAVVPWLHSSSWSLRHCRDVVYWIGPLSLSALGLFSVFSHPDSMPWAMGHVFPESLCMCVCICLGMCQVLCVCDGLLMWFPSFTHILSTLLSLSSLEMMEKLRW